MNGVRERPSAESGEGTPPPFLCVADSLSGLASQRRAVTLNPPRLKGTALISCCPGCGPPRWLSALLSLSLPLNQHCGLGGRAAPCITDSLVIGLSVPWIRVGWAFKGKTCMLLQGRIVSCHSSSGTQGRPQDSLASQACRQPHRLIVHTLFFSPSPNKLPRLPWQKTVLASGSCESNKRTKCFLGHRLIKSPLKQ